MFKKFLYLLSDPSPALTSLYRSDFKKLLTMRKWIGWIVFFLILFLTFADEFIPGGRSFSIHIIGSSVVEWTLTGWMMFAMISIVMMVFNMTYRLGKIAFLSMIPIFVWMLIFVPFDLWVGNVSSLIMWIKIFTLYPLALTADLVIFIMHKVIIHDVK